MEELAEDVDGHVNQIQDWKKQLLENALQVFGTHQLGEGAAEATVQHLHAKIGELTRERDFLS